MADSIFSLNSVSGTSALSSALNKISSTDNTESSGNLSFAALLESATGMIKETESYTNAAEEAELSYMLGLNDSLSGLLVAQTKANVSLQYTVAVRNAVVDAYKEIMNLQF